MSQTTEQQIEAIARECARSITLANGYNPDLPHNKTSQYQTTQHVLTAANRIAALKVKESGAVEALANALPLLEGDHAERVGSLPDKVSAALIALHTIINEGTQ